MPTLKKLKEDRLSITSKILKKDEDFLSISPEFIKDLRDKILLENYQKINWEDLSQNPNAISLLKENQDKINWKYLSANPAIFKAV